MVQDSQIRVNHDEQRVDKQESNEQLPSLDVQDTGDALPGHGDMSAVPPTMDLVLRSNGHTQPLLAEPNGQVGNKTANGVHHQANGKVVPKKALTGSCKSYPSSGAGKQDVKKHSVRKTRSHVQHRSGATLSTREQEKTVQPNGVRLHWDDAQRDTIAVQYAGSDRKCLLTSGAVDLGQQKESVLNKEKHIISNNIARYIWYEFTFQAQW